MITMSLGMPLEVRLCFGISHMQLAALMPDEQQVIEVCEHHADRPTKALCMLKDKREGRMMQE